MIELIDKWEVVSKLISIENEYQFFKGSEFEVDAKTLYRRICELEIGIGKTPGFDLVRCKDCIHWYEPEGVCLKIYSDGAVSPYAWQYRNADDYCSYGERKANG